MRTLVVTNDFPPRVGGINYYVDQIMRRFPEGEVVVFASSWPDAEAFDGTWPHRVVRWPSRSMLPTPAVLERVVELVREVRADAVLFAAALPLGLLGPAIARRTGVPYASFTHGVEVGAARTPGGRAALARAGRGAVLLTAVSDWTRSAIGRVVGEGPRFELLPAGIDAGAFHPGVSDATVRERHGLGTAPVVVCVSRIVARKGQDQVIRALPAVARSIEDVRFLVVGKGPYADRLRALARKAGVEDRVIFTGEVPYAELPAYFRAGDVFAMPCRSRFFGLEVEALGAVFYQASAVGRPNVAGDTGGVPDAVRDGETGILVDPHDLDEIAGAIRSLLADPERAAKMGAAGADWVHRDLTWEAIAARLRVLLHDAVPGGRA